MHISIVAANAMSARHASRYNLSQLKGGEGPAALEYRIECDFGAKRRYMNSVISNAISARSACKSTSSQTRGADPWSQTFFWDE